MWRFGGQVPFDEIDGQLSEAPLARAIGPRLERRRAFGLRLAARRQEFVGYTRERTGGLERACRGCPMRPLRERRAASPTPSRRARAPCASRPSPTAAGPRGA